MTTPLNRPVVRASYAPRWGDIVVAISSAGVSVREKGRRTWYGPVPFGHIIMTGAKMKADETRAEKKRRAALRRGAK